MRVSPHFAAAEFRCRDGTPAPPNYLYWMHRLAVHVLEPLREEFGAVTIVSGFRTASHNRQVGGAPNSYHLGLPGRRGAAADLTCARGTPGDWYEWLDPRVPGGLGRYPSFVHVDNRRGRSRW